MLKIEMQLVGCTCGRGSSELWMGSCQVGGIGWGLGHNLPLIDTARAISIKQQWWPGDQKTEASSEVVNAFLIGWSFFKSWAPVPIGFFFHMAETLSFGGLSAFWLAAFHCPGEETPTVCLRWCAVADTPAYCPALLWCFDRICI